MFGRRNDFSAVLFALPLALAACGGTPPPDPRTGVPLVRAVIIQGAADASSRSFTGTVAARVQSDLGFRVSGKVLERLVDLGQIVKRGQVLMRIDPVDLKLSANAQQEAVAAARARARQTADEEARYRDLLGTGAISASAYDQVKAAADAAKAQLNAAESQAEVARNASRYGNLMADVDGVVVETLAEPGQVVGAGQVVLRVAHAGKREAVIQLPETLRPAPGSTAQATLFGQDGASIAATLRQLSSSADRQTRTFEARYVLDGALADAPLGSTVAIRIPDGSTAGQTGWSVPIGALFDQGRGAGVWIIQGDPAKVSWRPVTVQRISDDSARVAGQLRQGDRVVALGAHLLHEGQQVRLAGQPAPDAARATASATPTATAGAQP
ncbi:Probable Co/Zn/Cd efflux system membrane fusion protein [Janthinobacterium sp. CG23_2]|nr:Probable Co/Zn/Cd efflux system membrane fusion protein [Janthinobacterium sp. CG23_2]CUU26451.1 Probable Co/Zn/Cd efflux system membrane fusion protein [Janthinobacterium sp. CG23_2]